MRRSWTPLTTSMPRRSTSFSARFVMRLLLRWWLIIMSLPVPVIFTRLAVPLWVFIFGMGSGTPNGGAGL